jgi:hypothetical protein
MMSSLTWSNWDSQVSENTAPVRPNKSKKERRSDMIGSEIPLFERLIKKLTAESPNSVPQYNREVLSPPMSAKFVWEKVSQWSHPCAGGLDELRAERKLQQLDNLLSESCFIIENRLRNTTENVHIIEFCAGAGYVAIPLADVC